MDSACWSKAWHGTHPEAVYSILYHGVLFESRDDKGSKHTLKGTQGVYLHKDRDVSRAEWYMGFVQLFEDGVFWAVKFEVRANRRRLKF